MGQDKKILEENRNKKKKNITFQPFIEKHVSDRMMDLIRDCGNYMEMLGDIKLENFKLHTINSCKNRFCPMCAWRKSRKTALELAVCMKWIVQEHDKAFIFLTLTVPNVLGNELESKLNEMAYSFRKLIARKSWISAIKGFVRKTEVTYNKKRNDYHPHYHCILVVNKSYFTDPNYYISRNEWLKLWQDVTKQPEITQVDVRRVKKLDMKAISEVAKYSAKDSDYTHSQEVFDVFYNSLKGKRLMSYGGLFKDARNLYKKGKLDYLKEKDLNEYIYLLTYLWGSEDYLERNRRFLNLEEFNSVNGKDLTELDFIE